MRKSELRMILYIDEIFIQHHGKKNKVDLNEDKKDVESLLKTLVKFHINVFIKMFCSVRNTDFSKISDGWYWQYRTHSLSCLSSQIPECLEGHTEPSFSLHPFCRNLLTEVSYRPLRHSEIMAPRLMSRLKNRTQPFPTNAKPAKTKCST